MARHVQNGPIALQEAEAEASPPSFESARVIPPTIWARHQDEIKRYKLDEKKSLAQIMALMQMHYGLYATYVLFPVLTCAQCTANHFHLEKRSGRSSSPDGSIVGT